MLTQFLFEYCIYGRIYGGGIDQYQFWLIVVASVFIAAAGNIINDYFDLNIDQVNKPDKVVVNVVINRRWVIFWHMLLSMLGLFFTVMALPVSLYWHLVLANLGSVVLLWLYSTNFKKQLLVGNVMISVLTAWVILVLFLPNNLCRLNIYCLPDITKSDFSDWLCYMQVLPLLSH
jgi:4-hydroxybenzoate polyprenyltransferase